MNTRERIEALARETFEEIQKTEEAYRTAAAARKELPSAGGDYQMQAKIARAEANLAEAAAAQRNIRFNLPNKAENALNALRQEYAQEIERKFAVDPEKLDMATLELLKSGIMRPAEYRRLFNIAAENGNATMTRLIAKYAMDAAADAAKQYGETSVQARELRAISMAGNADPASAAMRAFDGIAETFRRSVNNPGLIPHWDELTAPLFDLI